MAYGPKIQSKGQLKEYILRKLGSPVINIEITDEQLDDAIDDTIEYFFKNGGIGGMLERYVPITLLKGVQNYILPYDVYAVMAVHSTEMGGIANSAPSNIFSINQFIASDLYRGSGKIDLLTYEMTNQMLATLNIVFTRKITFDYNCISRVLNLFEIPTLDHENVMLHVYRRNIPYYEPNPAFRNDPTESEEIEFTNLYNELWIRKMSTERARLQWADNLSKYAGSQLPDGLNLDVPTIMNRANESILKLEEEFEELPVDFMIA
jgi:hypothetical protein